MAENKNTQVATQENAQVNRSKVTDFSLGIFGTSDNFIMANQMAKALSSSTIVPREYQGNVSNALIAIELAVRLKTSPLMVMQHLYVVYGRPSWSAQYVIAMINGSGRYDMELQFEETNDKTGKPYSCMCWTEKNGRKVTGPVITMDLAKAEGWVDKNGSKWKTMSQIMLRYRAASFFGRMNCPDLMMGMYTQEEAYEIGQGNDVFDIEEQVRRDIEANANKTEFSVEEIAPAIEEKPEPKTVADVTAGAKEKEPVKAEKKQEIPTFMKELEEM